MNQCSAPPTSPLVQAFVHSHTSRHLSRTVVNGPGFDYFGVVGGSGSDSCECEPASCCSLTKIVMSFSNGVVRAEAVLGVTLIGGTTYHAVCGSVTIFSGPPNLFAPFRPSYPFTARLMEAGPVAETGTFFVIGKFYFKCEYELNFVQIILWT